MIYKILLETKNNLSLNLSSFFHKQVLKSYWDDFLLVLSTITQQLYFLIKFRDRNSRCLSQCFIVCWNPFISEKHIKEIKCGGIMFYYFVIYMTLVTFSIHNACSLCRMQFICAHSCTPSVLPLLSTVGGPLTLKLWGWIHVNGCMWLQLANITTAYS